MVIISDKNKIKLLNKKLLVVFLAIQPVLELILALFGDESFAICGISITTLIRYGLIGTIFLTAFFTNFNRKCSKIILVTLVVYGIFIGLHFINVRNYGTGLIASAIYLSKYIIPIIVAYLVYLLEFNYTDVKYSVLSAVTFTSGLIIITNLLGVDYISYSFNEGVHPAANFLKWFDYSFEYTDWRSLTSRGLFPSGNELSSLFALLLPMTVYISIKEKKHWCFAIVFLQMLSMLMVGTRVSVYGAVMLFIAVVALWIFDSILNKKRLNRQKIAGLAVVLVLFSIFFFSSPFKRRINVGEGMSNTYEEVENTNELEDIEIDESLPEDEKTYLRKIIYIEKSYSSQSIPANILYNVYDYTEHPDFWIDLIDNVDFEKRNNARKIKALILNDIKKNNNSPLDSLVGIGEALSYPEQDYIAQYYYLGIGGILLFLAPFLGVLMSGIVYLLINLLKRRFVLSYAVLTLSLGFIVIVAYLAGHVVEPVYINSFIAVTAGMLAGFIRKDKI